MVTILNGGEDNISQEVKSTLWAGEHWLGLALESLSQGGETLLCDKVMVNVRLSAFVPTHGNVHHKEGSLRMNEVQI